MKKDNIVLILLFFLCYAVSSTYVIDPFPMGKMERRAAGINYEELYRWKWHVDHGLKYSSAYMDRALTTSPFVLINNTTGKIVPSNLLSSYQMAAIILGSYLNTSVQITVSLTYEALGTSGVLAQGAP